MIENILETDFTGEPTSSDIRRWVSRDGGVRGLSMKQPYANLMLKGKVETRIWQPEYRGWVLICVSQTECTYPEVKAISGRYVPFIEQIVKGMDLNKGMAIAVGKLVKVEKAGLGHYPRTFVDVEKQPKQLWLHHFDKVRAIKPFPVKGKLGYFELDDEIINQIELI